MALGRGLSALIPDKQPDDTNKSAVQEVSAAPQELETGLIKDNRFQPRQNYDEERLGELMSSIKEKGFLQPIVVRKTQNGYEVIAGERRLKAARKLGLKKVPVVIKEATDQEALVLAIVENVQREELNAIEKADSYRRLIDEFGHNQDEIAKAVGKDRVTIANLLRLLKLPEEIRKAVADGEISEGHGRALVSIEDPNAQKLVFIETVQKGLSVREVEALARKGSTEKTKKARLTMKDPEIAALEEELRRIFGTKVSISNKRGNKGKLVVEYYNLDDFDRILKVVRNG